VQVVEREGTVREQRVVLSPFEVVVGAEAEVVVLALGRGVDPRPLVAAEGALLVVRGDDVLPQLGTDGLEPVTEVADDREVAQDRVPPLRQVLGDHRQDQEQEDEPEHG
jgi:hypothetical protein